MAAPLTAPGDRIGELLMRDGLISREALERALQEQKSTGMRIGYNLVKLGFVDEVEITRALARLLVRVAHTRRPRWAVVCVASRRREQPRTGS